LPRAWAAFDKCHFRVRHFGGVFTFTVAKEALALAHLLFFMCVHASLHPVHACMALFEFGDENYFVDIFVKCAQRPRPPQPALHLLPRYNLHVSLCCVHVCMPGLALDPCLRTCMLTVRFAWTSLVPRPRSISAILEYVLLAGSLCSRS
jgi:hypothetical protein